MQFASDFSAARFVDKLREEHDRDERMAADLTMLRVSARARVRISINAYMKSLTRELPLLERTKEMFNCSNQGRLC